VASGLGITGGFDENNVLRLLTIQNIRHGSSFSQKPRQSKDGR